MIVHLYDLKENREIELNQLKKTISNFENLLEDNFKIQQYNWLLASSQINDVTLIRLIDEKSFHFKSLLNSRKIIFYIEAGMCLFCLDKELQNVTQLIELVGKNNIIIVAKEFSKKYLLNENKFSEFKELIYLAKAEIYTHHNLSDTPSLALVNEKGDIQHSYHASKNSNKHFDLFHDFLKSSYYQ
ncbi:MAG: hypothetical protein OXE77_00565 [Flavobacteriaceae bacterium]|nr:hypothetical protein [Flavobacteriaceae bacterium]MCY4266340.1 hypothetical protein [Flavobacteriaceae bacterium]